MRIKRDEYIIEVREVVIRKTDIGIGTVFYQTGDKTEELGKQLLEKGWADFSNIEYY